MFDHADTIAGACDIFRGGQEISVTFFAVGKTVGMDVAEWISQEHAGVASRIETAIVASVPFDRWTERAQGAGNSIAALLFHLTLHSDYAINCVLGGHLPVIVDRRQRLGLSKFAPHRGLAEAEDDAVTAALDVAQLLEYHGAVWQSAASVMARLDAHEMDSNPDYQRLETVAAVDPGEVPWLVAMWSGKPRSWFVQWEGIGHPQGHLGEMVSVRGRLGLSPF